jgi:hypothetical protein
MEAVKEDALDMARINCVATKISNRPPIPLERPKILANEDPFQGGVHSHYENTTKVRYIDSFSNHGTKH